MDFLRALITAPVSIAVLFVPAVKVHRQQADVKP